MDLAVLRGVIGAAVLVDVDACRAELEHVRAGRGLLDAREVEVLGRLDELTAVAPAVFPDDEIAKAARSSLSKAGRVRDRKQACDDIPEVGAALAQGVTVGERVDILARATAGLTPTEKARVAAQGATIAAAAAVGTDRQYRETIERIVGRARDDDGLDRLAWQRRATRLRSWTGPDGMWHLTGRFDPVRGAELDGRLRATIDTLTHNTDDDEVPVDPIERDEYLTALALHALTTATGTGPGSSGPVADVTVLIDEHTLLTGCRHDHTTLDAGMGRFGLPVETVRRWACLGTITPVIVGADGVRLFLGRETRLANRAQRRALRVMYRTCALCDTPFERTQAHHVHWHATMNGPTDIDNLIPLCVRHHHLVHEGGWHLHLAPDRTLTITRPDGTTSTHDPPHTRAA